jgi:MFS family permease
VTFPTVLRNPGYRHLWIGQVISQVGDFFALLAMMIVVSGFATDAPSIALAVAGLSLVDASPRVLFGVLAGVFVDRWDRRRTMIACDLLRGALVLAMIPAFLVHSLPGIYVLAFLTSAVATLFNPARTAILPTLLPADQLLPGNSLAQAGAMMAILLGPALAGLTISLAGPGNAWVALVVDAGTFAVSAWFIRRIAVPPDRAPAAAPARHAWPALREIGRDLGAGLRVLVLNRTVFTLALTGGVTMLGLGAANVLWLVYLKTTFGFGESELALRVGFLGLALAAGMTVSSVVVGNWLGAVAPKWLVVAGLLGAGLGLIAFGQLTDYGLLLAATAGLGLFVVPVNAAVSTLLQTGVPNDQLGKVFGGFNTITDAATISSISLAGALSATLGVPMVFLLSGLLCLGMSAVTWGLLPAPPPAAPRPQPAAQPR